MHLNIHVGHQHHTDNHVIKFRGTFLVGSKLKLLILRMQSADYEHHKVE